MIDISKKKKNSKKINYKKKIISNIYKYYFYLSLSFFSIFAFVLINGGYIKNYKDIFFDKFYSNSYINYLKIPQILSYSIKGLFIKVPELNINITFENRILLEKNRVEATGIADGTYFFFKKIPAKIDYENRSYKINLRHKGDRPSHFFEADKSSYKIELKNDKTIFGINKFSLMKPRMRNYIHEWIYHELMSEGNVINLKYKFVKLKINGENKGLYALEEGFDKILIERNKLRNGPIFSLKEEWESKKIFNKPLVFEVYNKKNWYSDKNILLTNKAANYLDNVFNKDGESIDIFEQDKWAWFLAVSDANYYNHGTLLKSVKFYYNPVSSKFEPIPFDGHRIVPDFNKNILRWPKHGDYRNSTPSFQTAINCKHQIQNNKYCNYYLNYKLFFHNNGQLNNSFFNKYKKNINLLASDQFLNNFFDQRKEKISDITSKIYGDYFYVDHINFWGPGIYYFNKKSLYERTESLKFRLSNIPTNILAYQKNNKIDIINWYKQEEKVFKRNDFSKAINPFFTNRNLVLKNVYCNNVLSNRKYIFNINQKILKENQTIEFTKKKNLSCSSLSFEDEIFKTQFIVDIDKLNPNLITVTDVNLNSFLEYFYLVGSILKLKKDITVIKKNIEIPKGYVVKIEPEQKIILLNNSFIISRSAFNVNGGDKFSKKPIEIRGDDLNKGGGIFLINTKQENFFKNIIFKNLTGNVNHILLNKYIIFGAINVYKSQLKLKDFEINNMSSEDALNVISSNFSISDGIFSDVDFDAIDSDYSEGFINNLFFQNIKNDALDFSESKVNVSDIRFKNIGDKAVSCGENSEIKIKNLDIFKSFLGIVSKDGSSVVGNYIENNFVSIPFASYKKKKEYDNAILQLNSVVNKNYQTKYYKDKFSTILIDNINQNNITKNIYDKIYNK